MFPEVIGTNIVDHIRLNSKKGIEIYNEENSFDFIIRVLSPRLNLSLIYHRFVSITGILRLVLIFGYKILQKDFDWLVVDYKSILSTKFHSRFAIII